MIKDEAIIYLEIMATNLTGEMIAASEDKQKYLETMIEAIDTGSEAIKKLHRYDLLMNYLVKNDCCGEGICDAISSYFYEIEADDTWCGLNCKFERPDKICYEKFLEWLEYNGN